MSEVPSKGGRVYWCQITTGVEATVAEELVNRYPVGVQSFDDIRRRDLVYVDKTSFIWDLAHQGGKAFFLSRPRRFGKSLLISTMQAYFEGRRELFDGLALGRLETEWRESPVIRLDMSMVKPTSVEGLRAQLDDLLWGVEQGLAGGERLAETLGGRLAALIRRAAAGTPASVVVLVDEYDAPLLNVIDDDALLDKFRQVMREFYIPLKACDEHLRFVFLTGITKFSQLSIFSELNNLSNISMEPAYAGICGITEEELCGQMAPDVAALAEGLGVTADEAYARLKDYYDGYHFCGDSPDIYNPFSLVTAFAKGRIGSYWFASGTPSALVRLVTARGWQIVDLENREALESDFDLPSESMDTPLPMLYQAGYLTIKGYDSETEVYTLGIPNREVSRGLAESLVRLSAGGALSEHNSFLIKLARDLRSGDVKSALGRIRAYLAGIPYHLGSRDERGFQTKFYLILDLLGIQIQTEFKTATGRVDAVVRTRGNVYVFEFKYGHPAEEALAQIDGRGYLVPFSADEGRLVKVGVSFSGETQTIEDWVIREEG